jgi:hypothetical protein
MIRSDLEGDQHNCVPFTIGWIDDRQRGYVHVLDDTTLDVIVRTLDTVTDFVWYLDRKEQLLASNLKVVAAGEEELLAHYLGHLNQEERHDFVFPKNYDAVVLGEGHWEEFLRSPERKAQLEADKVSYFWDQLTEKFVGHVMSGTQYWARPQGVDQQEKILRFLAREPRTRRRMLAKALLERVANTPPNYRAARVILPSFNGDPYYVFVVLSWPEGVSENDYRHARRELLVAYCKVVRLQYPDAQHVVGIATEAGINGPYRSEDALYYDCSGWTQEDAQDAMEIQRDLGLLKQIKVTHEREQEYPLPPSSDPRSSVSRNAPCPCGSRKRYKRCCGKGLDRESG